MQIMDLPHHPHIIQFVLLSFFPLPEKYGGSYKLTQQIFDTKFMAERRDVENLIDSWEKID